MGLLEKIDETIDDVNKRIQKGSYPIDEYIETVMALAALVEARAEYYKTKLMERQLLQDTARRTRESAGTGMPNANETEWRRFELLAQGKDDEERFLSLIFEKNLSRKDLAIILFGLRVRPGFEKSDFGI